MYGLFKKLIAALKLLCHCHKRSNSTHSYSLQGLFSFFGDFRDTGPQILSIFIGVRVILSYIL